MTFRVDLDIFRGPMDLLLYLVRKHELDVLDLPIAPITDQFLQHLGVIEQLDVNLVGDFLEMASTLMEIKSRMVLPRGGETEEEVEDPRHDLVQRLLDYKKYRDAASLLEERGRAWQERFARQADDLATDPHDPGESALQEVELWDLVSAFGRILRESAANVPTSIVYDDTPIHVYMERIHARLRAQGRQAFTQLFERGMHKSAMIGVFLAILELARHHGVRTEQEGVFGEIWIMPGEGSAESLELDRIKTDEYGSKSGKSAQAVKAKDKKVDRKKPTKRKPAK